MSFPVPTHTPRRVTVEEVDDEFCAYINPFICSTLTISMSDALSSLSSRPIRRPLSLWKGRSMNRGIVIVVITGTKLPRNCIDGILLQGARCYLSNSMSANHLSNSWQKRR